MLKKFTPLCADSVLPWEDSFELNVSHEELPGLSIVIPIFNAEKFLEKTIRSLLCNDLHGVEIILMDGGSTDATMSIVDHYKSIFSHIQSRRDNGQSDAINNGFKIAKGQIFYWLNGDYIILPNTLNKIRSYFGSHPDCDVLVGNAYMTEIDFSPINHFVFNDEKLTFDYLLDYAQNHLIQPSVFFSKDAWLTYGELEVDNHFSMDADLFIGLSKKYKFHHIDIDVAYSVYHEDCKTRGARAESIVSLALVQAKHGGNNQANKTLNILVNMYKDLEFKYNSGKSAESEKKIEFLESKLTTLERHIEEQKKLMIEVDLRVNK